MHNLYTTVYVWVPEQLNIKAVTGAWAGREYYLKGENQCIFLQLMELERKGVPVGVEQRRELDRQTPVLERAFQVEVVDGDCSCCTPWHF